MSAGTARRAAAVVVVVVVAVEVQREGLAHFDLFFEAFFEVLFSALPRSAPQPYYCSSSGLADCRCQRLSCFLLFFSPSPTRVQTLVRQNPTSSTAALKGCGVSGLTTYGMQDNEHIPSPPPLFIPLLLTPFFFFEAVESLSTPAPCPLFSLAHVRLSRMLLLYS